MGELNKEPAVRAKLSDDNTALFETTDDYLLWAAQISPFGLFDRFFRQAGGKGMSITFFKEARSEFKRKEVEAVLKKTMCTNGSTLFEAMQGKALGHRKSGMVSG